MTTTKPKLPNSSGRVQLSEWDHQDARSTPALAGVYLSDIPDGEHLASTLAKTGALNIIETRLGLSLETSSFVGTLALGPLTVTIRPKLDHEALVRLLSYAFDLESARHELPALPPLQDAGFVGFLIRALAAEGEHLLGRGLSRKYVRLSEDLLSPRGRIQIQEFVRRGGLTDGTLPCIHYPRSLDWKLNQTVRAGLELAAQLTSDVSLKRRLTRIVAVMRDSIATVRLHRQTMRDADLALDRLTAGYRPAIALIGLLVQGLGISIEDTGHTIAIPGYLFDMNRFFQALISRFLRQSLRDYTVEDEHSLVGAFSYAPGFQRPGRKAPVPRPDYAIRSGGKTIALLDAKYRDIWARDLPPAWLYQLTAYAMAFERRQAAIIYPTVLASAREERIEVRDPTTGSTGGVIVLRPIVLSRLAELVSAPYSAAAENARDALARWLAFGDSSQMAARAA